MSTFSRRSASLALAIFLCLATLTAYASAASSPTITGVSAGSIADTTAILHGDVNPQGSATHYMFEWGLTTEYGSVSPLASAGAGTKTVAVKFTSTALIPGTVYHYRLIATNSVGESVGTDETFTTTGAPPPTAATGPATAIGVSTATLTGEVNTSGAPTDYEFQYGLTTAYGATSPVATLPAASTPVPVAVPISALQSGAVFHYRIVVFHDNTPMEYGADGIFITEPASRPVPKLTVAVTPRTSLKSSFSLNTLGKISGPSTFPATLECTGTVTVTVLNGHRRVARGSAPVQSDCAFSVANKVKLSKAHGKHPKPVKLTVTASFGGNGYLAPRESSKTTVTVTRH